MAKTGLSGGFFALYAESDGVVTYSGGMKLAKSVDMSVTLNNSDPVEFYADNGLAESARFFSSGSFTANVDRITDTVAAAIYGATIGADNSVVYGADDDVPMVGLGWVEQVVEDGVTRYIGIIFPKAQFALAGNDLQTRGAQIAFNPYQVSGTIMRDDTAARKWRVTSQRYDTEASAIAWVKSFLSIT